MTQLRSRVSGSGPAAAFDVRVLSDGSVSGPGGDGVDPDRSCGIWPAGF